MIKYRSTGLPLMDLERFGPLAREVPTLAESRAYCRSLARQHYENFTVAAGFLPKTLKMHFYSIYAYCRWADDLADEDTINAAERPNVAEQPNAAERLEWWASLLEQTFEGYLPPHPVFVALHETANEFAIPQGVFADLLIAFRQDQTTHRYATRAQLLDYCRHSANPVGRLILYLARTTDAESFQLSDAICTGLQLANFWQDTARDWRDRQRIYLPAEDLQRFGCAESDFESFSSQNRATPEFCALIREQVDWAQTFFERGRPLMDRVPSRFRRQIRLFHDGGMATLNAIRRNSFDVWKRRPTVSRWTKLRLLLRAILCR